MSLTRAKSHRFDIGYAYDEIARAGSGVDLVNANRYTRDLVRAYAEVGMGEVLKDTYSIPASEICDWPNEEGPLALAAIAGNVRRVNDYYRQSVKERKHSLMHIVSTAPVVEMPTYLTNLPPPEDPEHEPRERSVGPGDFVQALRFAAIRFWVPYRGSIDHKKFVVTPGTELRDAMFDLDELEPGEDVLSKMSGRDISALVTVGLDPDTRPQP